MFLTRLRGITAITVAVLALLAAPSVEARTDDLFTPVDEPLPQSIPSDDLTVRTRMVTIDFEQLRNAQAAAESPGQTVDTKDTAPESAGATPSPGTTLTLAWQQNSQNFVITEVE